jgi:hydrogenase expression/formation protein HypE
MSESDPLETLKNQLTKYHMVLKVIPPTKLSIGKIPEDILKRCILGHLGTSSKRVLMGAAVGEDAPVIDMGDTVLVAKANPVTGTEKHIGRLTVHINANDVAVRGAKPLWFSNIIFLAENSTEAQLKKIVRDINNACLELGVQVIGGHTECISGLRKPIVAGFMLGEAPKDKYITTGGAKLGDKIILTKSAGLEGTWIFAEDMRDKLEGKVNKTTLKIASRMINEMSVVPETFKAVETGGVHSLHTPTEGGIINGLYELMVAANVGLHVEERLIPVAKETSEICKALNVDPLKLLSSGALLMAVDKAYVNKILTALEKIKVKGSLIGDIKPKTQGAVITLSDGSKQKLIPVQKDELFRLQEKE